MSKERHATIDEAQSKELAKLLAREISNDKDLTRLLQKAKFPKDNVAKANESGDIYTYAFTKHDDRIHLNFYNSQIRFNDSNRILNFISLVMNPVHYLDKLDYYESRRQQLNTIMGLFGWSLGSDGKLKKLTKKRTIAETIGKKKTISPAKPSPISDVKIETLEQLLVDMILDFIIKSPTSFQAKSRSLSIHLRRYIKERDNYQCQLCQIEFMEEKLEVDHIFPYSLGGSNDKINLMSLCKPCNLDKGKRLDFYRSREGRIKLETNIRFMVKELSMISNFAGWIKSQGKARKKNSS